VTEVRTLSAADQPCVMYLDHGSSRPVRTQGHHRHPQSLQIELTGVVDPHSEISWLCGTCHDSVHAWLDHLLGRAYRPPTPPARLLHEAELTYAWYTATKVSGLR